MFKEVQKNVLQRLDLLLKEKCLFTVDVSREEIWDTYLNSFTEETKQGNNCNCCRSFLRQYGNIVSVDSEGNLMTLWDFNVEGEYKKAIKNLHKLISGRKIVSTYLKRKEKRCGTDSNFDLKREVTWNHFYFDLPQKFLDPKAGEKIGEQNSSAAVFKRGLEEISVESIEMVLELIDQNSLYRGKDYEANLLKFQKMKKALDKAKPKKRENLIWRNSVLEGPAMSRVNNSAIGTLLNDISEGKELDKAVRSFEKMVAPANYKRPKPLVTKRMIEDAKKTLDELGLTDCLNRRLLRIDDLNVNNSIFVNRKQNKVADVFSELKGEVAINPKTLSKTEEISLQDFVEKVLPKSKSVKILLENRHLGNFAGLIGPNEEGDKTLFKWGNNYSWAYSGDVADSIKERVKKAGGDVKGEMRVSLSWSNHDDLDLHVIQPNGSRIYYGDKRGYTKGVLDVDMNAGCRTTREPVENTTWTKIPTQNGSYKVIVNQYRRREQQFEGFEVEIELQGEVFNFSFDKNGSSGKDTEVATIEVRDGSARILGDKKGSYSSKEKWGLKTGLFHEVKAITTSPNYWGENKVGNKHFFFLLENCFPTEKLRPFYNEFLDNSLNKNRKVFEVLGDKLKLDESTDGLAGLGFSETMQNDFFVEVEGSFKRTLKVIV